MTLVFYLSLKGTLTVSTTMGIPGLNQASTITQNIQKPIIKSRLVKNCSENSIELNNQNKLTLVCIPSIETSRQYKKGDELTREGSNNASISSESF